MSLMRVYRDARPARGRLVAASLLGALAIGCSVGLLATSAFLISMASTHPPVLYLEVAIVMVRGFGIGRGVFRYAERIVGHDAAFRSLTDLRIAIYDRLAVIAPSGARLYRGGDLLSRLIADVDAMLDFHLRVLLPYAVAVLVGLGSVLLVLVYVPGAALALALALLIGGIIVPGLTMRLVTRTQRDVAPATGRLTAETVTLVDGAAELIALGRQDDALTRIRQADRDLTAAASRAASSGGVASAVGVLAQGGAVIAAIILGTMAVRDGALEGVNLATVVLVPLAAYEAVQVLPAAVITLVRVRESARRIVAVIDAPDPVPDPVAPEPLTTPVQPAEFRVTGLRAGWTPGEWLVDLPELSVAPGSSVAIVGPSGCGKSTIAMALARMAPSQAQVHFGDLDVSALAGDDVRRIVGLSQQEAYLFDTTIAENIRLANRAAADGQILGVLNELGLGGWIAELPEGIHTPVGRFGRSVSGGQRQRIALARILVSDQPVVIADEPTEHLDAESAALVIAALHRHCAQRALIVITHREVDAATCHRLLTLS